MSVNHNGPDFILQVNRALSASVEKASKVTANAALEIFGDIVNETVVDTGALRSSWRLKVNSVDPSVEASNQPASSTIQKARGELSAQINNGAAFTFISITNNQPYAKKVEFGQFLPANSPKVSGGYSKLSPQGMLRKNIARWDAVVQRHARLLGP